MPAKKREPVDPLLVELRQVRGLLTLLLLKSGASSDEIGAATGVGASTVRTAFPKTKFKLFAAKNTTKD